MLSLVPEEQAVLSVNQRLVMVVKHPSILKLLQEEKQDNPHIIMSATIRAVTVVLVVAVVYIVGRTVMFTETAVPVVTTAETEQMAKMHPILPLLAAPVKEPQLPNLAKTAQRCTQAAVVVDRFIIAPIRQHMHLQKAVQAVAAMVAPISHRL